MEPNEIGDVNMEVTPNEQEKEFGEPECKKRKLSECPFKNNLQKKNNDKQEQENKKLSNSEIEETFNDDLRQFDVLDDLDHHSDQDDSGSDSDSIYSVDSDIPDEEVHAMLEEGLSEELKNKRKNLDDCMPYEEKEKLVLQEIGHNHFDALPEGWVQVTHNSGMPLYLHKQSRVCTLAKPYFLGPGSVRKHEVPVSAVPCLQYRRALEEENEEKRKETERESSGIGASNLPSARIETIQENLANHSLDSERLRNYCQNIFRFKKIKVMRFQSWSARRKFTKNKKNRKQLERPTLPGGTKLITFPIGTGTGSGSGSSGAGDDSSNQRPPKHWIMNPSGKSFVCILHEYVQHALKKQPTYKFKELENAATPYSAIVCINDMEYGVGFGSSKKQAKADAARKTLEILIPQMRDKILGEMATDSSTNAERIKASRGDTDADLSFFDDISITDPRVAEFCAKTTEPSPHAILVTCLQRNFGLGDVQINYSVNTLKHQQNEFTMKVGKHEAKVVCRNKKEGKQQAAQAILKLLHPSIPSWGSLLRLYGSRSVKSFKEKKQQEQEITLLQGKAAVNQPNHAILNKLRHEMKKLSEQRQAVQPIGKFISSDLPSGSAANLNNVNL
ncbi:GSCOCG00010068001-RA-CDS [Cotesia congregata]|nr:GSCOCG00010068001-RA-CDS [Cotesia congregata]